MRGGRCGEFSGPAPFRTGRSGRLHHPARFQRPVRGDDLPVRQQLTGVLEEQDAVAQQAPALFRMVRHQTGGFPVG